MPTSQWSMLSCVSLAALCVQAATAAPPAPWRSSPIQPMAKQPIRLELNTGRYDKSVRFVSRSSGATLFYTDSGVTMVLPGRPTGPVPAWQPDRRPVERRPGHALRMRLVGSQRPTSVMGLLKTRHEVNYFIGRDAARWRTHVPTYAQARFTGVYPGTDLVYYGNGSSLEYDFVVKPGADPARVRLSLEGATGLRVASNGDLVAGTTVGDVHLKRPYAYQMVGGRRVQVACSYSLAPGARQVALRTARYDTSRPLVLDPTLDLATYMGSSGVDFAYGCAINSNGDTIASGYVSAADFPATPGAIQAASGGALDGFLVMVPASGLGASFATYLGGSADDYLLGCAVDASDDIYVVGRTASTNFPVTAGAYQTSNRGGQDHALTKLSYNGADLMYSTYIGGTGSEANYGCGQVTVNSAGQAVCALCAGNSSYPVTTGTSQTAFGGSSADIAVTVMNAAGSGLVASTFLGGGGLEGPWSIALGPGDDVYVAGFTTSSNFPTSTGAFRTTRGGAWSGTLTRLSSDLRTRKFSTYMTATSALGGDFALAIMPNSDGSAYFAGATHAPNFPVTSGTFQTSLAGGLDGFIGKISSDGRTLPLCTYFGSFGTDALCGLGRTSTGDIVVAGYMEADSYVTASTYAVKTTCDNDLVVAVMDPSLSETKYVTFVGGVAQETAYGAAFRGSTLGLVGASTDSDSTVTDGAFQTTFGGGYDGYMARFTIAPSSSTVAVPDKLGLSGSSVTLTGTLSTGTGPVAGRSLAFTLAGSQVGSAITDSSGVASLSYSIPSSTTPPGDYLLSVEFAGEPYLSPASGRGKLSVQAPTALAVTDATGYMGETISLTATLTTSGAGLSGKTVAFQVDSVTVGSATTNASGGATLSYTIPMGTAAGSHTLTAKFAGDSSYATSSESGTLTANKIVTALAVDDAAGIPSMTTTLSATLGAGGSGLSGKTVTFTVSGSTVGTATTNSLGVASMSYTVPGNSLVGNKSLGASFAGDGDYNSSTGTGTLSVDTIATSLTASAPATLSSAAYETVSAKLTQTKGGGAVTGKTISFSLGGTSIGSATTGSDGTATLEFLVPDSLSAGAKTLTALFAGTVAYADASATASTAVVDGGTVNGYAAPAAGKRGDLVRLYCYLYRDVAPRDMLVGKTVTITVDRTIAGTAVTNATGCASLNWTIPGALAPGSHTLTYAFEGDSHYGAWTGTKALVVNSRADLFAGSMPDGSPGATVVLYAYLYDKVSGEAYSSQELEFQVDGTTVGSGTTDTFGKAAISYTVPTGMSVGDHTITVLFAGNAGVPSASGTGKLVVKAKAVTAMYVRSYPLAVAGTKVPLYCYLYVKQGTVMLAGKSVTIRVDGVDVATPTTDSHGYAEFKYTVPTGTTSHVVSISFAGDTENAAVSGTGVVTVP